MLCIKKETDWDRVVQIAKMFADIAKFAELKQSFQSRECLVSIIFGSNQLAHTA